ncbi:membrane hypothetical protein [Nitrospina gracilis 3/211]|uniref:DUF2231 domain-containing protein n=1 Tax=Nitrospina gracilis (strain 3/211) TaxID=1266370 RepID=M1YXG5_NITG3|nr:MULTISPECIES: hypothetical protein [Nitrospina]MCF8723118.1 putative membrane protein [Nitrospina sp. Nb-3]CCQ90160.1 membrane hypothetical protein [Nitrospina gracilis 3/211]
MLSTPSLHPFLSHFPVALAMAGLLMMGFAKRRNDTQMVQAAAFNFSAALLMGVMAIFSGLFAVDLGQWPVVEVEGHQGYSFAFVIVTIICTIYSYTNALSRNAFFFYIANVLLMAATAYSGYLLVFHSTSG